MGDKEKETHVAAVRERTKGGLDSMSLYDFKKLLSEEFKPPCKKLRKPVLCSPPRSEIGESADGFKERVCDFFLKFQRAVLP